jgi:predicted RNA-binding protein with PUA-like domain
MAQYWLMKCEPDAYSIDDLIRDKTTGWEGVRNYQVRNFMRSMQLGDKAFFYHSNAKPSGIAGLVEISKTATPDLFAMQPDHKYFDPRATPENPIWLSVEVRFLSKAPEIISLQQLREIPELANMLVLRKGSRLSITPVTEAEFQTILKLF